MALTIAIAFLLLVIAYMIVRVGSIAHFRSRAEYDRGEWEVFKNKGEDTNG